MMKDERLFSFIARNTTLLCSSMKIESLERKVIVGEPVRQHGFMIEYKNGEESDDSDEEF